MVQEQDVSPAKQFSEDMGKHQAVLLCSFAEHYTLHLSYLSLSTYIFSAKVLTYTKYSINTRKQADIQEFVKDIVELTGHEIMETIFLIVLSYEICCCNPLTQAVALTLILF